MKIFNDNLMFFSDIIKRISKINLSFIILAEKVTSRCSNDIPAKHVTHAGGDIFFV